MNIFKILDKEVIQAGLCTHCCTCVGLSKGKLSFRETRKGPLPALIDENPGQFLSEDVLQACPGYSINYPELNKKIFGQIPENWLTGNFRTTNIGYSNHPDIRTGGASGGVITHVLIYLLENKLIDGAIVVKTGNKKPYHSEAVIATSVDEIKECSQSVYAPVPVNTILEKVNDFNGRLAYVGLPDQVASIRQLQASGNSQALSIKYILGPYVNVNMYFDSIRN